MATKTILLPKYINFSLWVSGASIFAKVGSPSIIAKWAAVTDRELMSCEGLLSLATICRAQCPSGPKQGSTGQLGAREPVYNLPQYCFVHLVFTEHVPIVIARRKCVGEE